MLKMEEKWKYFIMSNSNNVPRIVILMDEKERQIIIEAAKKSIFNNTSNFCKALLIDAIVNNKNPYEKNPNG